MTVRKVSPVQTVRLGRTVHPEPTERLVLMARTERLVPTVPMVCLVPMERLVLMAWTVLMACRAR